MIGNTYKSRLENSKRNIFTGLFRQVVSILLNFIVRTVIIYILGVQYQGLSGLFTSILQVLNLSELGFSAAVTFILYKPIAENDTDTICSIMSFLKKAYKIIGFVILIAGLTVLPFVKLFIKGEYPSELNIYVLYMIYLFDAVISYLLFAYKSTLLTAMQRIDLVANAYTIANILGKILQIVILIVFENYYFYVFMILVTSVTNNILVYVISNRMYPDIKARGEIKKETKASLVRHIKSIFLNKIGDVARNSFDNIVLSTFVGLTAVAVYDNYYYIFSALYGIMGTIIQAIRASIGNSLVKENIEKNYKDILNFSFIFMWLVGWCSVCMFVLYQPFMNIWMSGDNNLLLDFKDMMLFCLYFYAISMAYTKNAYLEAKGLFYESRYLYISEALGNLVLNIILGYFWGVTGILIATIVTIFIFNFLGGTFVLFKYYFKKSSKVFLINHMFYFSATVISAIVTWWISNYISIQGIWGLCIRLMICIVIPNAIYLLIYYRRTEFLEMKKTIKRIVNKNKNSDG